ncbi:MAG TPA: hypothetical protein VFL47_03785, partial [Flavisolibacter sp.]|nr:hypothetical protein [Flavisolibacter sp.]
MKRILIYLALICNLIAACQNANTKNSSGSSSDDPEQEAKKKVSKRDLSINKANAYSDLFFDSTAMEKFITSSQLPDSIARRMRSFYNTRNYQFAWFTSHGLTEQARGFWNLHDYVTTYDNDTSLRDKSLQKRMDALTAEESLSPTANGNYLQTELTLTQHFIKYILSNYEKGYVKRKEMERFIPYKRRDPMEVADSLLTKKHNDNKYFEDVHAPYRRLKEQLGRYYQIAKNGGWPQIP